MAELINLSSEASQSTSVILGGQNVDIRLYYRASRFFMDVDVEGVNVRSGAPVLNNVAVLYGHMLKGNLVMMDTVGATDPQVEGLGSRYRLYYLTADEAAAL